MVKRKQGLHLPYEQRAILRKKLGERFGSMENIAIAVNKSTKGKARTTRNTPVNATNFRFYLGPHETSQTRPITPSIAKAMYELCGEDLEINFLKEYAGLSDISVNPKLLEGTENKLKEGFEDLEELRAYTSDVHYNGIKSMLDRVYENQQDEEQRRSFFGALEDLIKDFTGEVE